MIETHGKLIISGFVVILIGVILIQPIGDDIERLSVSSFNVSNETVALSNTLEIIVNESVAINNDSSTDTGIVNGTLANNNITVLTALRNWSSENLLGFCNVTLGTGFLQCNITGNTTLFADYTHVYGKTGALSRSFDEWISLDFFRNATTYEILHPGFCNFTISDGSISCNNTRSFSALADYQYQSDNFVRDSTTRTLLRLTTLFFAIAVMALGAGMVIQGFRMSGLM